MQLADQGALRHGECRTRATRVVSRIGGILRRARIDDAVREHDLGVADHHQGPGDAPFQRDLGEWVLDDQARRAWRHRGAVGIERETRHQRAVAQHELAWSVIGRCRQAQRAAAEDEPVEHQRAARADVEHGVLVQCDQGPGAVARGHHRFDPGRAGVGDAVDLEHRRLRIGETVFDDEPSAGARFR